jgi:DNA polymerase (family 10)
MTNAQLAGAFDLLGDLLEIQGENRFRVNSYRRAARTINDLGEDIASIAERGGLEALPGIGKGTAAKITQFLEFGRIDELEKERSKLPEGLPALLQIPGMGPKKVAVVWRELGVGSLEDLKAAIDSKTLHDVAGFGPQSAGKIASGIAFLERSGERVPAGPALALAQDLANRVRAFVGVQRVRIAGSLRRGCDTIGDIDLLCVADDGPAVVEQFVELDGVESVLASGGTKGSVVMGLGERGVQVDLRVVPAASFGAASQYFTGSKEHNVRLRERAIQRGLRLNEWGLFADGESQAGADEEGIYGALELPWVPPEQREDRGEFEQSADFFDALVSLDDIRGDLHMHTTASDGRSSLEDMAAAAKCCGYAFINITDHSPSSVIAGGLSIEQMLEQIVRVRAFNDGFAEMEVLVGTEVDILSDGTLDYPDEILAQCDIVVASIHAAQSQDADAITARIIRAVEHPGVDIIGHPTGRLIGKRAPAAVDIAQLVESAADTGTALEINASWRRLDLKDQHAAMAAARHVLLAINTDAHHVEQLDQMRLGISTARRAGARTAEVLNTWDVSALRQWKATRSKRCLTR